VTTDFPVDTYSNMLPVDFPAPPVNPAPFGLYAVTAWTTEDGPTRFLNGVQVRNMGNYGGADAFGVWGAPWCPPPPLDTEPRKEGTRPADLDPFDPIVVWAYDQCDARPGTQPEIEARAAQILRLEEQTAVERTVADRLLMDADDLPGTLHTESNFRRAVCYLEAEAAKTNTMVWFHASPSWASDEPPGLVQKSGTSWVSPLGHTWIFGGGYVDGLQDTIVATSRPFGWRNDPTVRSALAPHDNLYVAVAERTVAIAYEAVIAAVSIG